MHEARRLARLAAEKRRLQYANSGQRLGGFAPSRGENIRKVIADAAQRRIDISRGCANNNADEGWRVKVEEEANRNGFRTRAEEEDANARAIEQAFIEMIQEEEQEKHGKSYTPPRPDNPMGRRGYDKTNDQPLMDPPTPPLVPSHSKPGSAAQTRSPSSSEKQPIAQSRANEPWSCPICTLNNPAEYLCCDACGVERSLPPVRATDSVNNLSKSRSITGGSLKLSSQQAANVKRKTSVTNLARLADSVNTKPIGWNCHQCGTFMESKWWTCSSCGTMKLSS